MFVSWWRSALLLLQGLGVWGRSGGRGTFLGLHHPLPSWASQHTWLEPGPAPPGCGLSERLRSRLPSESVGPEPI